ncbi:MAG: AAA family ATPase [Candidatus Hydrogenedentota bacterium]|nr:MAG: AAA family ATPase [Candidatus Hydrogenedentota bacterium]
MVIGGGEQLFARALTKERVFPHNGVGAARMKKLPIGIQNFEEIATRDYIYVDKTPYLHKLLTEGKVYFLSRPRRFGKSLLISTLENIFLGKKHLFEGLWIHDRWEFEKHPVVRIDMVAIARDNGEVLREGLLNRVRDVADEYAVKIKRKEHNEAFHELIRKLSDQGKVVVLIDEYDKPIIDHVTRPEIAKENREVLKNFYGILKAADEYLKFVLLTGVSKFARTSIFSDLNNLYDITMTEKYNNLLGYEEQDLDRYFGEYLDGTARKLGIRREELRAKMRHWYNGYRFSEREEKVYNPFSVLQLFGNERFDNYWFESGTPTFLVELMRERNFDVSRADGLELSDDDFSRFDVEKIYIPALLFQTGYLTIEDQIVEGEDRYYRLGYPNYEVEKSLLSELLVGYAGDQEDVRESRWQRGLKKCLRNGDLDGFFELVKVAFLGIPYEIVIKREDYYNSLMYLCLKLAGLEGAFEVMTNRGRLDCALELEERIYIFEFKIDEEPQKCIEQIREKGYPEKYRDRGKPIDLVGVTYSSEEKNISNWKVERL